VGLPERLDKPDEKDIATFEGGAEVAYFRDPHGKTLSIAKKPGT